MAQRHMATNFKGRVRAMQALLAVCLARAGKPGAVERKEAVSKRTRDRVATKANADKQAVQFGIAMGLGGDGIITLAEGLVDVDVTFREAKRARWGRSRTTAASRGSTRGSGTSGGTQRRTGVRRRATAEWDSSESEESDSDAEEPEGRSATRSESRSVHPGDLLRIYWTEEEVWFRCEVQKVFEGTNDIEVEYLVAMAYL